MGYSCSCLFAIEISHWSLPCINPALLLSVSDSKKRGRENVSKCKMLRFSFTLVFCDVMNYTDNDMFKTFESLRLLPTPVFISRRMQWRR
jgi:hypothetical protein